MQKKFGKTLIRTISRNRKQLLSLLLILTFSFTFLLQGFVTPKIAKADGPTGIQMTFSGSGTTYQYASVSFNIPITSNQQLDSTSVSMKVDGQVISSTFQYKGHWESVPYDDDVWVVDSLLEGTVTGTKGNLSDGAHTLSVTAADINGIPQTFDWNFNVNVKPVFSNPVPLNGTDTKDNTGLSVKVTDNDGINASSIVVNLDGNTVTADYDPATGIISYTPTNGLSDGPHTVSISLQDITGNAVTYNSTFTVCVSGPNLTFANAGQTLTNYPYLSVDIQSFIKVSNSGFTVKLDGQAVNATFSYPIGHWESVPYDDDQWVVDDFKVGKLSFWTPTTISDGIHTLEVTAKDYLGTATTESWNFNVAVNPVIGNPTPANGSFTRDNTGFLVKITDNTAVNPASIVATLDGTVVPTSFDSVSGIVSHTASTPIGDGLHTVNVAAEDFGGNQSSFSWSYNIKTIGPTLDLVQKNQTLSSIPNLTVNIASDVNLSDTGYTVKLDGQPVNAQFQYKGHWQSVPYDDDVWVIDDYKQGTLAFTPGTIRDGLHTVEVTAKDYLGNETTQSWSFTLAVKAQFSQPSPANGVQTNNNSGFSVKVVDSNDGFSGDSSFSVRLNGNIVSAHYDTATNILSYTPVITLLDGTYTVEITATDIAGTQSEYNWTYTVITAGPNITFNGNGQTFFTTPTLTFSLQSQTDISPTGFSLSIDGKTVSPLKYSVTFMGHWEVDWDGEEYYVIDSYKQATVTYQPSTLINGEHTIRLNAMDVLGNTGTIQGIFNKLAAQTLSITSPANDASVNSTVNISASTNLTKMNISLKKLGTNQLLNLGDKISTSGTWTWDTTKVSDGEYTIILTGYDSVDNSTTTQQNIKVANIQEGMGISHYGTVSNGWGRVNIANGNFIVNQSDIELPGRGLGTEFSRVYNSQLKTNGPLGWGWRINLPELALFSDNSVVITNGDGTKYTYTLNVDGTYNRPVGRYEVLSKNADNNFELKLKDGTVYVFDTANNRLIIRDKNNNAVTYQYDGSNKLTSIADASGRVTTLTYNSNGYLTSVQDYSSRTWAFAYDTNNNLIKVTDPLNHFVTFAYDSNHLLTSVTDANSNTTYFTYTSTRLTAMTDALNHTTGYSYDENALRFTETDPKGRTTTWAYDTNWNITSITDAGSGVTSFTYDSNYNVLTKTDALNRTTSYTYDFMGNVLSETDSMNNAITYAYDQNNNLLSKTDAKGVTTTFAYDATGNLSEVSVGSPTVLVEEHYDYDQYGNKVSYTNKNGHTTTYEYDANGNMKKIIYPAVPDPSNPSQTIQYTEEYGYDAMGNRISEKDPNGGITNHTFDALGRETQITYPAVPDPANPNNTIRYNKQFVYDNNGNKLSETDQNGNVALAYQYDALNRVELSNLV